MLEQCNQLSCFMTSISKAHPSGFRRALACAFLASLSLALPFQVAAAEGRRAIDFNRDIRPILSDNCFACHGPDKHKRKAGLRLDREEGAVVRLESGNQAIVPGNPEASRLMKVILSKDDDEQMPPAKTGKRLSSGQVALLREWIAGGAPWQEHWAYLPVEKPMAPEVQNREWTNKRNVIVSL